MTTSDTKSLIDHIATNGSDHIASSGVIPCSISDHDVAYANENSFCGEHWFCDASGRSLVWMAPANLRRT